MSKIIAAAEAGNLKTLKALLDKASSSSSSSPNSSSSKFDGSSGSFDVSNSNSITIKLARTDAEGFGAIHYASMNGHLQCVEALLNAGANPSMRSKAGVEPLMLAAQNNHIDICRLVVSRGAKIDAVDNDAQCALLYAAQEADASTIDYLIGEAGADPNVKDHDGWATIHYAAQGGLDILKLLVKKYKVDLLQSVTSEGSTALHVAAEAGEVEVCDWILSKGKNYVVNNKSSNNNNSLSLIIDAKDTYGNRPLHFAACSEGDNVDLVKLFVEKYNANVFVRTLHLPAEKAREQYKKHMEHQFKTTKQQEFVVSQQELDKVTDIPPKTPYEMALECGNKHAARYLRQVMEDVMAKNESLELANKRKRQQEEEEERIRRVEELQRQERQAAEEAEIEAHQQQPQQPPQQQRRSRSSVSIVDPDGEDHHQTVDSNVLRAAFDKILEEDQQEENHHQKNGITKTQCLTLMMTLFPEESVSEFTAALKSMMMTTTSRDGELRIVNFEICLRLAKSVVEGEK